MRRHTPTNPPPTVRNPTLGRHTMTMSSSFDSSSEGAGASLIFSEAVSSDSLAGTVSSGSAVELQEEGSAPDFLATTRTSQCRPLVIPIPSSTTRSWTNGRRCWRISLTQSPIWVMLGMNTTSMPSRRRMGATCGMRRCADGMSRMAWDKKGSDEFCLVNEDRMPVLDRRFVCSAIQFSTGPT